MGVATVQLGLLYAVREDYTRVEAGETDQNLMTVVAVNPDSASSTLVVCRSVHSESALNPYLTTRQESCSTNDN